MIKKKDLPKTIEDLQNLNWNVFLELWNKYLGLPARKNKKLMLRPLWYKIQCINLKQKVLEKNITKLNRYGKEIETFDTKRKRVLYVLKPGTQIIKTYKEETFQVSVMSKNKFLFDDKFYSSLSAVAKIICGIKVSGPDFFGLNNKQK